jgi:hypothetical protein
MCGIGLLDRIGGNAVGILDPAADFDDRLGQLDVSDACVCSCVLSIRRIKMEDQFSEVYWYEHFTLKVINPTTIEITEAKASVQLFKCSSNSRSL